MKVTYIEEAVADIVDAIAYLNERSSTAASNPKWEHVYCAAVVAANTSIRPVEVKHLRRRDVELVKKLVHVRWSKNETSY